MKKLLLTMMLVLGAIGAKAGDYDYLIVVGQDNTTTAFLSSGLSISFSGSNMTVTSGSTTQTFDVSSLSKMYFGSDTGSGIKVIEAVIGSGTVEVFTLSGASVGKFENLSTAKGSLPQGVYVMKSNGKAVKIAVK